MRSFRRIALLAFCFALGLTALLSSSTLERNVPGLDRLASPSALAQTPVCPTFTVPAVTHGFTTAPGLPNGDLFLLPTPFTFTVTTANASVGGALPTGLTTFTPSVGTFGGTLPQLGGFAGLNTTGFSFSTPGGSVNVVSCADSFWDIPFIIATSGATVGDKITFYLQVPPNGARTDIAVFTIEANGVRVTSLQPGFLLYNNRLATGAPITVGSLISLNQGAGAAGNRTAPLLLAFPMGSGSPFMGCFFFGANIMRGAGVGTTSLLFSDIIVNRNTVAGDVGRAGTGLIGGLTGGFPTGQPCAAVCAACLPPLPEVPAPVKCDTICFRSAEYWLLHKLQCPPGGVVYAYGFYGNLGIGTGDQRTLELILRGSPFGFGLNRLTPIQRFNQQYVTAQLNLYIAGGSGSPVMYNVLWANLSCYDITFAPITLSNGFTLTRNSMVKDLFMQAQLAILENRAADAVALTGVFNLLNGNSPFGFCN
jgi:hypothetical protein